MSFSRWLFKAVAVSPLLLMHSFANNWCANELYTGSHCTGTPNVLTLLQSASCDDEVCTAYDLGGYTLFLSLSKNVSDRFQYTDKRFEGVNYIMMEEYEGAGCQKLVQTTVYPAIGSCKISSALANTSDIVFFSDNGTAGVYLYNDGNCMSEPILGFELTQDEISNSDCMEGRYRFYTGLVSINSDPGGSAYPADSSQLQEASSETENLHWAAIIAIVAGVVACVACLAYASFRYVRRRYADQISKETEVAALASSYAGFPTPESALSAIKLGSEASSSQIGADVDAKLYTRSGKSSLWDDETIITARVPREKVIVQDLLSRGGYGEVYSGQFNGELVAVKMLLPEMRKSMSHLNAFLAEVKLMATLNHERIVQFVGVAWDSLTDLCVLSEFMEGGDLRTLLKTYEEQNIPLGFDDKKVTIALHVAHALTYLHSLFPPVLHRDLKSKNILLTAQLDAKLTDFGVSRERSDFTMTGGVGSSRWMAPEVMMGERYDDKADMFSFGVVLSELDQHLLPYSNLKEISDSGRAMPDLAILQLVASGKLRIQFSSAVPEAISELGYSCVAINPKDRPTAADALYKLHTALATQP